MTAHRMPTLMTVPSLGFALDFAGVTTAEGEEADLISRFPQVFEAMNELEAGAIANPDEKRMVGHYWLRDPARAPQPGLREAIETTLAQIKSFSADVRSGKIGPRPGVRFTTVLQIGIGGSALGPQLASDCLGDPQDPLAIEFLDNTDPDGMERVFRRLGERLRETIVVVVSKSGGTPETRNGMLEAAARLRAVGCVAPRHMVAITGEGSALEKVAKDERWLATFPMWDWVGGRTSQTSAVGLVPMALLGHDIDEFLAGARLMDEATREADPAHNPAARLAIAWHRIGGGRGDKAMVVLPYRDRLLLMSRYLQQLVMESLGKQHDLAGNVVQQGIAVYGNKGSTDQHAYVQQLRDGRNDFFVTFIAALHDAARGESLEVEPGITSGDYLLSFLLGTRRALTDSRRQNITITIPVVSPRNLGALIALFERSVGYYASYIGINAYHQPGVEAGKKAAAAVLALQQALVRTIGDDPATWRTAAEWATRAGHPTAATEALWLLEHLAGSGKRGIRREGGVGDPSARFAR